MKICTVEATLPELKGGMTYQTARAEGSSWPLAVYRALKQIARKVGRHRITTVRVTIAIANKVKDNAETN